MGESLRKGSALSCGCLQKERVHDSTFKDLTGQKFGRLTVIKRIANHIQPNGASVTMWECQCECGNIHHVSSTGLIRGDSKSCGCLKKDISKYRFKYNNPKSKVNIYDLSKEYGICYTNNYDKTSGINYFYFDKDDYEKIKKYTWYFNGNGYAVAWFADSKKHVFFHRFVTDCQDGMFVDHKNHTKHDNRKENLRLVSILQNNLNKKPKLNGNTGITGVYYRKDRNKFAPHITFKGKRYSLGSYDNLEDAIAARKEAEKKYFGEYSYANSVNDSKEEGSD